MTSMPVPELFQVESGRPPLYITTRKPKVAIIHYWLIGMRGGEKVIEELSTLFPDADIYTHLYDPKKISDKINAHTVRTTSFQNIPFSRLLYKKMVTFMPAALEELDLTGYDLVISSESGPAKGVIVRPGAMHICYVHTPMRYIWDQYHKYFENAGPVTRFMMPRLLHSLRQWDVTSAARVDHFIANSAAVAGRIERYWRRDSEVISPPVNTARFRPKKDRGDFYLFVSELVSYKRADLAILACNALNRRLVVIGDGPEAKKLKKMAGPNIEFLGRVPDRILEDHVENCRALLFPAEEDFGIVPVEAMAAGAPVIAYGRGGAKDYVLPGQTGLFVNDQTVAGMIESLVRFELMAERFDPVTIANHAAGFDSAIFRRRMMDFIIGKLDERENLAWLATSLRKTWQNERSEKTIQETAR